MTLKENRDFRWGGVSYHKSTYVVVVVGRGGAARVVELELASRTVGAIL